MVSRRNIMVGGASLLGALGSGCVSAPRKRAGNLSLNALLQNPAVQLYSLSTTSHGRMIVDMALPNGRVVKMMLDTGATRSALYNYEWQQLSTVSEPAEMIRIFGMISTGVHPVKYLNSVMIGGHQIDNVTLARLPIPDVDVRARESHDGILGMDILSHFHLYYDGPRRELRLIPTDLGTPSAPVQWRIVPLSSNPFLEDGRNLHFMKLRIGNVLFDGLLDTGSEFNLMNWNIKRFPRLRAARRRLKERWEIEGAIGSFSPVFKVTAENVRAGQKLFDHNEFIVLDFETLNVLGIEGRPFAILGADALKDERYILNFQNDTMVFEPRDDESMFQRDGGVQIIQKKERP